MSPRVFRAVTAAALLTVAAAARRGLTGAGDPLATEIGRWSDYLKGNSSTDEMWTQVKEVSAPALERTGKALQDGRRLLALQMLAAVRMNLAAFEYLERRSPAERKEEAGFEAEW